MNRLNDEQLSRVLSALAGGTLGDPSEAGDERLNTACLVQTCDLEPECEVTRYSAGQREQAKWFDDWRANRLDDDRLRLPVERFLAAMERAGIA